MAGRKDKNIVDYFPHYCISGKTLFIIESKFNHVGYAVWFKTLELLGSSENHYIDLRDESDMLFLISKLKITESQFTDIYNLLAKLGAIDEFLWKNKIVYSDNFIKNINDAYIRRKNKCMNKIEICEHLNIKCVHKLNESKHKSTKESKVKESKVKESIYREFAHLKISIEENKKLIELGYNQSEINSIYDSIENYKKNTSYKSLYLTSVKWLKKEYPYKSNNLINGESINLEQNKIIIKKAKPFKGYE